MDERDYIATPEDKYTYNRHGMKGSRVGQALYDISLKDHPVITVGDITENRTEKFLKELTEACERGAKKYESPFYVVHLTNKEMWATNMIRCRFLPRQSEPIPINMVRMFPYFSKDVFKVDARKGSVDYIWTLPSLENIRDILKNKHLHDPQMVKWVQNLGGEKKPYDPKDSPKNQD